MIGTRLKEVRKSLGLTQEAFATKMFATRAMIASYELGRVTPTENFLNLLSRTFNVNNQWLKHGDGDIFNDTSDYEQLIKLVNEVCINEREEVKKAMLIIATLTENQLDIILRMTEEMQKVTSK